MRVCLHILLAICVSGCTVLRPVEALPGGTMPRMAEGDEIRLTRADGSVREMTVTRANAVEVCEEQTCVPLAEVAYVEKRQVSVWRTVALAAGLLLVAAAIAIANANVAFMPGAPVGF